MNDRNDQATGPKTDQERELLEAYGGTEDAGRVLIWSALLAELDRRSEPWEEAGHPRLEGGHALSTV